MICKQLRVGIFEHQFEPCHSKQTTDLHGHDTISSQLNVDLDNYISVSQRSDATLLR